MTLKDKSVYKVVIVAGFNLCNWARSLGCIHWRNNSEGTQTMGSWYSFLHAFWLLIFEGSVLFVEDAL